MWADGKTVGQALKCCSCHYLAQRPSPISTSKAVPIKAQVKEGFKSIFEDLKEQLQ